ncbi:MAG: hypothetical protein AABZ53_15045 [Planctomycetota bacterium]
MRNLAGTIIVAAAATFGFDAPQAVGHQPAAESKAAPTVEGTLAQLHAAYRAGPLSDRVTVRALTGTKVRTVQVVIYTDAGEAAKERPAQLRLDLQQLQIHAMGGKVVALNRFEKGTCFETEYKGEIPAALAESFRPLPLPQVSLTFGADTSLRAPVPLAPDTAWITAEASTEQGRAMVVLKGRSSAGEVSLTMEKSTGRLRRFSLTLASPSPGGLTKLELISSPSDAGDSKKWGLETQGRTRVGSPSELAPKRASLAAGVSIKNTSLVTADLANIAIESLFAKDKSGKSPVAVVLVCFRAEGEGGLTKDTQAALSASVRAALDPGVLKAGGVVIRGVGLLGPTEIDPPRLALLADQWAKLAAEHGDRVPTNLLFSSSRVLQVEHAGQAADSQVVVIDPDQKALAAMSVDGQADKEAETAAEIVRAIVPPEGAAAPAAPAVPAATPK